MKRLDARCTATFIVRIWAEYVTHKPPAWRGEIEHVQTRQVSRFRDLGQIEEAVRRCVLAQLSSGEREDVR